MVPLPRYSESDTCARFAARPAIVALSYRVQVVPEDRARLRAKRCGGRLGPTPYTCMLSVVHPTRRLRPRALVRRLTERATALRTILANDATAQCRLPWRLLALLACCRYTSL